MAGFAIPDPPLVREYTKLIHCKLGAQTPCTIAHMAETSRRPIRNTGLHTHAINSIFNIFICRLHIM